MRWPARLQMFLLSIFRPRRMEAELDAEIRDHLEQEIQNNIRVGMSPAEAKFAAHRLVGSVSLYKEECRDARGSSVIETFTRDLRYSIRILRRTPLFTAVAILTLALGIGATTTIFSVINGVLLKPLPYPHPEELVAVGHSSRGWGDDSYSAASTYFIYREQSRAFQDTGLYRRGIGSNGYSVNITGLGEPEHVSALGVTDGVLPILGAKPLAGRLFTREDDSPGAADTAILSYNYWRRKFGGDRSVIGRTIIVDGKPCAIIGVLPQSFRFLDQSSLALLLPMKLDRAQTYLGSFIYGEVARMKPGVTLGQAGADLARMFPMEERSFPLPPGVTLKLYGDLRIRPNVKTLKETVVGDVGKVLWVLMGGVGLVLLIACANVANLLLLRIEGRRQELAIRAALGASRGRIGWEMSLESFLLALLGSALALGLAYAALRALVFIAPAALPRLYEIAIDWTTLLFTLTMSLAATLLIGSISVMKYAGLSLETALREGGRSLSESRERHRSRGVLVVVQVALALVLLVSSGLMIRTFRALTRVKPGFAAPSELQTFRVDIPDRQVKDPVRVVRMLEAISQKIEAIPGVSSVRFLRSVPMDNNVWVDGILVKDHPGGSGEIAERRFEFVVPGVFKTLGTPFVAGRDFTWREIYNKGPVVIISEKLAREYWHDPSSALGKQIRAGAKDDWREVVGVVGDVHDDGVDKEPPTSVYWPILVANFQGNPEVDVQRNIAFAIRSPRAGSEGFMNEVRRAVWSVNPNLALADIHTLDYYYTTSMARTSFTLVMLGVAGCMALLLGIVGLYGVIAYSVSQRRREIGIRMALGAQAVDALTMVLRGGFKLAVLGAGIGIVAAFASTRYLASLLYGVNPTDPPTFIAVSLLLITVALIASYIPARQAAKVDPIMTLRHE